MIRNYIKNFPYNLTIEKPFANKEQKVLKYKNAFEQMKKGGCFECKFIINEKEWQINDKMETKRDSSGNVNNLVYLWKEMF